MCFWHNPTSCVSCSAASLPLKFRGKPHKEAKTTLQIPMLIFAVHINTPLFPETFHSRVYFAYCRFYCSCWKPTEAFTSDGKEGKKLTKRAVASCRLLFPELFTGLPSAELPRMAAQQLGPAVAAVDSGLRPSWSSPCAPVGAAQ